MFSELKNHFSRDNTSFMSAMSQTMIYKVEKCLTLLDHLWNPFDKYQYFLHSKSSCNPSAETHDVLYLQEPLPEQNQSLGFTLLKVLEFPGPVNNKRFQCEFEKVVTNPLQPIIITKLCTEFVSLSHSSQIVDFNQTKSEPLYPKVAGTSVKQLSGNNSTFENYREKFHKEEKIPVSPVFCLKAEVNIPKGHEQLNQERIVRKKKQMLKLSKRRRRRTRKEKKDSKCPLKSSTQSSKICYSHSSQVSSEKAVDSDSGSTEYATVCICSGSDDSCCKNKKEKIGDNCDSKSPNNARFSSNQGKLNGNILVDMSPNRRDSSVKVAYVNPTLSFILGHVIETESEDEVDFNEVGSSPSSAIADLEFSQLANCFFTGFASLHISNMPGSLRNPLCEEINVNICEFSNELSIVNAKWNEMMSDLKSIPRNPSKVSFAEEDKLTEVTFVEAYERKGEWEILALERIRFKERIAESERTLAPFLSSVHRKKVYERLFLCD